MILNYDDDWWICLSYHNPWILKYVNISDGIDHDCAYDCDDVYFK